MGKRREARQSAVQFLFARELQGSLDSEAIEGFWQIHSAKDSVRAMAQGMIDGVLADQQRIAEVLVAAVENFRLERLATVDRNILRLAVHELMSASDVPVPVILNEAIEIAKALGGNESGAFVNGVLHRLAKQLRPRP
jgi:N utilization substance protein B